MELDLNAMSNVSGGTDRMVNTGVAGLNAALRAEPRKGSRQITSIPNGEHVDTLTNQLVHDNESGRNFVQVSYKGIVGWIAASIIGMPR